MSGIIVAILSSNLPKELEALRKGRRGRGREASRHELASKPSHGLTGLAGIIASLLFGLLTPHAFLYSPPGVASLCGTLSIAS